jgi:hypothetical protein
LPDERREGPIATTTTAEWRKGTAGIRYAVIAGPVEDATADNLRALAEVIDLAQGSGRGARLHDGALSVEGGVLVYHASGSLKNVLDVAEAAWRESIFPDVTVGCEHCRALAGSLLEAFDGITVRVVEAGEGGRA